MYLLPRLIMVMVLLSSSYAESLRDPFLPLFISKPLTKEEESFGATFIYQPMKYLLDPSLVICVEPKMLVVDGVTHRENEWIDEQLKLVKIDCSSYTVRFAEIEIVLPYGSTSFRPVLIPVEENEVTLNEVSDETM